MCSCYHFYIAFPESGLISFQHSLIHSFINYLLSALCVRPLLNLGDSALSKPSGFSHPYFRNYRRPSVLLLAKSFGFRVRVRGSEHQSFNKAELFISIVISSKLQTFCASAFLVYAFSLHRIVKTQE